MRLSAVREAKRLPYKDACHHLFSVGEGSSLPSARHQPIGEAQNPNTCHSEGCLQPVESTGTESLSPPHVLSARTRFHGLLAQASE